MFNRDHEWLHRNKETLLASSSWADFCERMGDMGAYYKDKPNMEAHYDTVKAKPHAFLYHALRFPNACKATDLFSAAYLCPHKLRPNNGGSYTEAPPNTVFVGGTRSGFAVSRSMGGRRSYRVDSRGDKVRQHFGSTFFVTYAALTPDVSAWYNRYNAEWFNLSSIEAIDREDGVLIVAKHAQISGGPWLALLDKGETLETMFDDETRKRLAEDREAERAALE